MPKRPEMILFDYGQTLGNEKFDGIKGTAAVMKYCISNKYGKTPEQVQAAADEMNREIGRFDPKRRHLFQIELPNYMFTAYLYESQGIELSISGAEIDRVFWNAAAPAIPTEGIEEFLWYLENNNIRTGVISNICYDPNVVEERICDLLPDNHFEFIIPSSSYIYRKPNKRLFDLALQKANLTPDKVWYVGDQYEADIMGARNAGIFPVWYTGAMDLPYKADETVLTVNSWSELMEYIRRLHREEMEEVPIKGKTDMTASGH